MKVITRAEANERGFGHCVLTADNDGPYLDTGFLINVDGDPYAIVHVPVVEAMGRAVGMHSAADYEALEARIEELEAEQEANAPKIVAWDALTEAKVPA